MFRTFGFLADWVLAWHQLLGRGSRPPRAPGGMLEDIFNVELGLFLLGHTKSQAAVKNESWPRENPPWCRGAWQSQEIWVINCMTLYLIVGFCMSFSFFVSVNLTEYIVSLLHPSSSSASLMEKKLILRITKSIYDWSRKPKIENRKPKNQFTTGPENCS